MPELVRAPNWTQTYNPPVNRRNLRCVPSYTNQLKPRDDWLFGLPESFRFG